MLIDCDIWDARGYQPTLAKQLVLGYRSKDMLQKLQAMAELDPDKLFKVMEAEERSNVGATVLHHALPSKLAPVSSFPNCSSTPSGAQGLFQPASKARAESAVACGNCGRQGHATYDPHCPAQGSTRQHSTNRNKTGHFACCCRSKTATQKGKQGKSGKQMLVQRQDKGTTGSTVDTLDGIFGTVQLFRWVY